MKLAEQPKKAPPVNPLADVQQMRQAVMADEKTLGRLGGLVNRVLELEDRIRRGEDYLKKLKEELRYLTEKDLPGTMTELRIDEFSSQDHEIKIRDVVRGSLPRDPEKREKAIMFMREHGGEDILQATINVTFTKGDVEAAESLAAKVRKLTNQEVVVDLGAHHSSYAAWARSLLQEGEKLPLEDLDIYAAPVATVKPIKKAKLKNKKFLPRE